MKQVKVFSEQAKTLISGFLDLMHINYAANQLSSSEAMRIAACCQLNLCSLFVGVKLFSQLAHLCYPAGCDTVPSLPGRDRAWS